MHAVSLRRTGARTLGIAALAAFIAVSALASTVAAKPALGANERPTIVLVHGGWGDPAGWDQVRDNLAKDGYTTVAPRLDLHGLAGDVATVTGALDAIPGDKILVGHSIGGIVISNAAYGRSDVLGLVYTAAYMPDQGETVIELGHDYNEPALLHHLVWTGAPFASLAFVDPAFFREVFASDLSPKKAQEFADAQQATNLAILFTPSGPVAWHTLPSWYAVSGVDRVIDPNEQRFMADRAGATTVEFDDASHVGGFTHYANRFTKLIEEAVAATAG